MKFHTYSFQIQKEFSPLSVLSVSKQARISERTVQVVAPKNETIWVRNLSDIDDTVAIKKSSNMEIVLVFFFVSQQKDSCGLSRTKVNNEMDNILRKLC